MKVVPVKLSDSLTNALDELVRGGFYTSRNDALRDAVRSLIEKEKRGRVEERERLLVELKAVARVVAAIILSKYRASISRVILFGSVARGEVNEESDVDLLIIVRDGDRYDWRRKFIEEVMLVTFQIGRYISIKTFTEKEFESLIERESPFLKEVLSRGVSIYETEGSG